MIKKNCDIVVIGGGGSGLVAGARAASLGRSVIVLEKDKKTLGGGTNMASTMRTFGSKWQKERTLPDTTMLYLRNRMDETFWRIDRKIASNAIRGTGWFFDWFQEIAPEKAANFDVGRYAFDSPEDGPLGPQSGGMGPGSKKGSGRIFVETMVEKLQELGQEILMDAVTEQILTENGKVVGVKATVAGEPVEIECKAVIIASGSWVKNPEVVAKYYPNLAAAMPYMGASAHMNPNYTGDGLKLAEDAGVLMDDDNMTIRVMGPMTMSRSRILGSMAASRYSIYINTDGKRYICEGSQQRLGVHDSGSVQVQQPEGRVFVIFDENTLARTLADGDNQPMPEVPMPIMAGKFPATLEEAHADMDPVLAMDDGMTYQADSLEALAEKINVDPATLRETVENYNGYCAEGMDWDCYKPSDWLAPITGPHYYAVRGSLGTDGAFGGIQIDENMRAKAKNGGVVDGLYAVGDICSGRFINMAGIKMQVLNDMSFAVSSGFIAGTGAAEYVG